MEPNNADKLTKLEEKINLIYISVEKTRKYFLWTMIITVVAFVLPFVGLLFAVPSFMANYVDPMQQLMQ